MKRLVILIPVLLVLSFGLGILLQRTGNSPPAESPGIAASPVPPAESAKGSGLNAPAAAPQASSTDAEGPAGAVPLWANALETNGQRLDPTSAEFAAARRQSRVPVGRTAIFDAHTVAPLGSLRRGSMVTIP